MEKKKQKKQEKLKMKKVSLMILNLAVFGMIFSFIGVTSVSAARASTNRGEGCYVRVDTGENDYLLDSTCTASDAIKFDNAGNFEFYVYQDHGQLPEGSWRPTQAYRSIFDQCFQFTFGVVCGTTTETVTPSGEYKSSFRSN